MSTDQKIAVITGANRGLGRAHALHLAETGVDVVVTYRANRAEAEDVVAAVTARGRSAVALRLDAGDVGSFAGFAERLGSELTARWDRPAFDFLVNNAGTDLTAPFAETTEKDFDDLVNVHLKGVFFLTQALLPLLADGGAVVNVSSGLTRFAVPGHAAYGAVKGAVEILTRYQARELGARGIRVNTIAPGATATDFGGGMMHDEQVRAYLTSQVALGRVGEPDDIGAALAALLSDANRWVTGQRIEISGGQSL
ncbi:SDR family oxidoreductase [Streptomyces sp. NBC_01622]|uniref:SDR family NAD(P)-dependent oxidoreductase n=1 Tax=Streptomyces sp. NBC_01622 TaxID=2975903 RepID=UPI0038686F00|nr:SDR family oxidoreductase [Streptomyces sp. NBC_01622]